MNAIEKTWMSSLTLAFTTALAGTSLAQTNSPPAPAAPQGPGINVQVPAANGQKTGVGVQVPGVNVQVGARPGANAQVGVNSTYYPQTPWFSNPAVREELKLNDRQYEQLNQNYTQSWTKYNQERNLINDKLTPQQRQQREGELGVNFHKTYLPTVDTVLTDPASRQRFNQLHYQYQGYGAFQDPAVQKQLNLTPAQQQQFAQYGTAWNQQLNTWRNDYATNADTINKQWREARIEQRQRINSVLTPEQRTTWNNLYGQPYEFQPDVYFPSQPTTNTTLKPVIK